MGAQLQSRTVRRGHCWGRFINYEVHDGTLATMSRVSDSPMRVLVKSSSPSQGGSIPVKTSEKRSKNSLWT